MAHNFQVLFLVLGWIGHNAKQVHQHQTAFQTRSNKELVCSQLITVGIKYISNNVSFYFTSIYIYIHICIYHFVPQCNMNRLFPAQIIHCFSQKSTCKQSLSLFLPINIIVCSSFKWFFFFSQLTISVTKRYNS